MRLSSISAAVYFRVVFLRFAGVVCINYDIRLLDIVVGLVYLAAVVFLVCDCVLRAGALSLTVVIACVCCLLRAYLFVKF